MPYDLKYSVELRNAQNDQHEVVAGPSPICRVFNGTVPANCAAALAGNTLLAAGILPADWMSASDNGIKAKTGTWALVGQAGAAGAAGTFFRIYKADGTTCTHQGTFGVGTYDMQPDVNSITSGQLVSISTFAITRGNA